MFYDNKQLNDARLKEFLHLMEESDAHKQQKDDNMKGKMWM
jgi:hypothetical protein